MNIVAIVGITVVAAALALLLKQYKPEYAMGVSLITGVVILILIISRLNPVIMEVTALVAKAGMPKDYGLTLFKALGMCFLVQLASDSCRDVGETALASKVELAGKAAVLLISLPLFQKVADIAFSLISA